MSCHTLRSISEVTTETAAVFRVRSNFRTHTQRAHSAPVKEAILITTAEALEVAVLGTTVPRALNLQCFATL
jgi:hypothetical protein